MKLACCTAGGCASARRLTPLATCSEKFATQWRICNGRPIVALAGRNPDARLREELALTNALLFRRDRHTCAYCGDGFTPKDLSRDHVVPCVQGGKDVWTNVVTACRTCSQRKGGRRPEQTRSMQLLFVPYAPCLWEHFILSARGILADQMDFLAARLPRHSRILN